MQYALSTTFDLQVYVKSPMMANQNIYIRQYIFLHYATCIIHYFWLTSVHKITHDSQPNINIHDTYSSILWPNIPGSDEGL